MLYHSLGVAEKIDVKFSHSIYLEQRVAIMKGLGKQPQVLNISWYTPSYESSDVQALMIKTLPLSNYLSQKTGYLTLIENNTSEKIVPKNLDFVWSNMLGADILIKQGWIPLLKEDVGDYPVLVGLSGLNVKNFADLKNKKIVTSMEVNHYYFMMYSLLRDGVLSSGQDFENFQGVKINEKELYEFLLKKRADLIVMNKSIAENMVLKNTDYKIIYVGKKSIGNILLANPKASVDKMNFVKNALLLINGVDDKNILMNFQYSQSIKPIYDTDVILITDIFSLLRNYKNF